MITSRTRAVVLLGAAFALGLAAGGAGMAMATRSGKVELDRRGNGGRNGGSAGWMRELDLSDTQRDSVDSLYRQGYKGMDSIIRRIRPQTDSLFATIRPDLDARRALTRDEVRKLLTAPQLERYDSMVRASDEQRRRSWDQRGSGGPPRDH